MGCGTSEPRGITQATRSLRLAGYYGYIYSYPWDDRPTRLPTRAGIAISIDGRGRRLAPLVAAETAAHPRLSEL